MPENELIRNLLFLRKIQYSQQLPTQSGQVIVYDSPRPLGEGLGVRVSLRQLNH